MCQEHANQIHTELRQYNFKGIFNFRDLGGYATGKGKKLAWRRLYRSGELHHMSRRDFNSLKWDMKPVSVIDLREPGEGKTNETGRLNELGVSYHAIPLPLPARREWKTCGELFIYLIEQEGFVRKAIDVLRVLSEKDSYPAIIHCNAGKNRTGIMSSIVLAVLGVSDNDIIQDYLLSAKSMQDTRERMMNDPALAPSLAGIPEYVWEVEPESIQGFLQFVKERYGSMRNVLKKQGADDTLFKGLEESMIIPPPDYSG